MLGVAKPRSGPKTAYRPEMAASLRQLFEAAAQEIDRRLTAGERDGIPFPTAAAWRQTHGVSRRQFELWRAKHPDFKGAHAFGRQLQRELGALAVEMGFKFTLVEAKP